MTCEYHMIDPSPEFCEKCLRCKTNTLAYTNLVKNRRRGHIRVRRAKNNTSPYCGKTVLPHGKDLDGEVAQRRRQEAVNLPQKGNTAGSTPALSTTMSISEMVILNNLVLRGEDVEIMRRL